MFVKSENTFVTRCGPVMFIPGMNEIIKPEHLEYLKTDKSFSERCSLGQFKVIDGSGKGVREVTQKDITDVSLKDMKQSDAVKLVKEMFDREKLVSLLEDEKRPKVKVALKAQLDELNKDDEKPDEGEE